MSESAVTRGANAFIAHPDYTLIREEPLFRAKLLTWSSVVTLTVLGGYFLLTGLILGG